jgi:hypothetical protein
MHPRCYNITTYNLLCADWLLPWPAGDTRPTETLSQLAAGSDVFVMQNMGPIKDLGSLSFESQLLINVSAAAKQNGWFVARQWGCAPAGNTQQNVNRL